MHPMPTVSIHRPEFQGLLLNGCPSRDRCGRIAASWMMAMDSKLNPTMNDKKEQVSVQVSTPSIPKVETLRSGHLHFDRLQPSDQELLRENRFEFGQFVAREAALDEEYWTAAWLRAESHWEDRTFERYIDNYKRKFAEQEYNAVKRRCRGQNGNSCTCIIMVKKEQKNVKCSVLKSVVGTLDLNIRLLLQGETFPGERVKAPLFCNINRKPPIRYGYIANLCVAKSARRKGIASNMLYFAVESARSNGVEHVYVHVDRNNRPAQMLYKKMGFEIPPDESLVFGSSKVISCEVILGGQSELLIGCNTILWQQINGLNWMHEVTSCEMVEMAADAQLLQEQTYLLCLHI